MKFSTVCLIPLVGNSILVKVQICLFTQVSGFVFKYCDVKKIHYFDIHRKFFKS